MRASQDRYSIFFSSISSAVGDASLRFPLACEIGWALARCGCSIWR